MALDLEDYEEMLSSLPSETNHDDDAFAVVEPEDILE